MKDEPGFHRPPKQKGRNRFNGNRHQKQHKDPKKKHEEKIQAQVNCYLNQGKKANAA